MLPLLSYQGQVVACDGYTLEWLDRDGHLLHPPVQLFPTRGQLFDLSITLSTSIVTMVYRCGFLSTYTVGRPISMYQLLGFFPILASSPIEALISECFTFSLSLSSSSCWSLLPNIFLSLSFLLCGFYSCIIVSYYPQMVCRWLVCG